MKQPFCTQMNTSFKGLCELLWGVGRHHKGGVEEMTVSREADTAGLLGTQGHCLLSRASLCLFTCLFEWFWVLL